MIQVLSSQNKYSIKFGGNDFHEILQVIKKSKLSFNPDSKLWEGKASQVEYILEDLNAIEPVVFKTDIDEFKQSIINETKIQIKRRRYPLRQEFFYENPPIGEYQKEDVGVMLGYGRIMNAYDCGLGKTYTTIQVLNHLLHDNNIDSILITCIPAVIYNWKVELLRFSSLIQESDITVITKDNREIFDSAPTKIMICSYNTFALMSDYHYLKTHKTIAKKIKEKTYVDSKGKPKKLEYRTASVPFDKWGNKRAIILDESHRIKTWGGMWPNRLHLHKHHFDYRYCLSGTPMTKDITDLYSQLTFLDDSLIPYDYQDWVKTIANVGTQYSEWAISSFKEDKVQEFLERVKPFIIRRAKKDYLDLPDLDVKRYYSELSGKQLRIYQLIIEDTLFKIKEEHGELKVNKVANKFPHIMSALSNPCLYNQDELKGSLELQTLLKNWKFGDSAKVKLLEDVLEDRFEAGIEQLIIWEVHPKTIDQLAEHFKHLNPLVVHGQSTPKGRDKDEWRDEVLLTMKKNKKHKLLIANPATIGEGKNIQFIKESTYFSRSHSLIEWIQSLGRTIRPGMVGDGRVNVLMIAGSLEIGQDRVLQEREELNSLLKKDYLTQNEWKDLFTGKGF